jgi:hypothetical protein
MIDNKIHVEFQNFLKELYISIIDDYLNENKPIEFIPIEIINKDNL